MIMPKYKIMMREDRFLEFVFESEETDIDMAYFRFIELPDEDQKRSLVNSDCFTWEIESIEPIGGE